MAKQVSSIIKEALFFGGMSILAVAVSFEFNANSNIDHASSTTQVHTQQIQIQVPKQIVPVLNSESPVYKVKEGDSYHSISLKYKPKNVNLDSYVTLIKNINLNEPLRTSQVILLPSEEDLKSIVLPSIVVHFDYKDESIVEHLKQAEGSKEFQSKNKRRLLNGYGYSFKNNKFFPYQDIKGNYTIAYGHYIGKKSSEAMKFKNGLTSTEAHELLLKDMKKTHDDFVLLLQNRDAVNLSKEQQRVLYEMAFTLGIDKLNQFSGLWKSVSTDNDKKFKKEIKDSLWYRQLGERSELLVSML